MIQYRSAREDDAEKYVAHMNKAGGESDFLAFSQGEFYLDAARAAAVIAPLIHSDNQAFFVAEEGDRIVGICILESSHMPRLAHAAELRIAVQKEFWGSGVAKTLMNMAVDFFERNPVLTRLALQVSTRHERGIELYRRFGFADEGIKKMGMRVGDTYHDLVMMAVTKGRSGEEG